MDLSLLKDTIERAKKYQTKLIIVTGKDASRLLEIASAVDDFQLINMDLELSEKLVDIPKQNRPKLITSVFADLLIENRSKVLCLDHIHILFDCTLSVDPLKLLRSNAKNLTLVVAWPGDKNASSLSYATPNHPEYRSYKVSEYDETIFIEAEKRI